MQIGVGLHYQNSCPEALAVWPPSDTPFVSCKSLLVSSTINCEKCFVCTFSTIILLVDRLVMRKTLILILDNICAVKLYLVYPNIQKMQCSISTLCAQPIQIYVYLYCHNFDHTLEISQNEMKAFKCHII